MKGTFLTILVLYSCIKCSESATAEDVERLFQEKLSKSNPKIRPVWNQSNAVNISFQMYIVAMTDLNEIQQKVEATVWLSVKWQNELIMWNKTEYGDLEVVYPDPETMWRPDLAISNGYNELNPIGIDFVIMKVFHNGLTVWMPGQKIEFLCSIDVTKFPFDTQNCFIDFFNWGGTIEESTLYYSSVEEMNQVKALHPNSEWEIIDRTYQKFDDKSDHDKVRVFLTMKRKSTSLVLSILLPVILLAFLNVFVFLLPTESGEKLSFAVTVLLSQAVFLSFISSMMPQTSDSISGLSVYISAQLVLSTLYVLLTCWILRLYHRDTRRKPLSPWLLKAICLNTKNTVQPFTDETDKINAFDDWVASGNEVSYKVDRVSFWFFFMIVALMTTTFLFNSLFM